MTFLLDSNIVIYSLSNEYAYLRKLIVDEDTCISEITRVEVLGYHGMNEESEQYFQNVFSYTPIVIPDKEIYEEAIRLRRRYNLKLGDSIVAATALARGLTLYTRNLKDFERIEDLNCVNPVL